ncbi:unnamed protein product [Ceratitis capitata]|uniref:(Mediterranean fruit fly) hypothetical protein n=1 Tax=Ceratitis capitata TaxID=7213 RepID=A0A811U776_CERCA|nr:unnamed protein product [Ceratitis capitata]
MHFNKKTVILLAIIALILATASATYEGIHSTLEPNNRFEHFLTDKAKHDHRQSHASVLHAIRSPDYPYSKLVALKGYGIFGANGSRHFAVVEWAVIALSIYMLSNVIE